MNAPCNTKNDLKALSGMIPKTIHPQKVEQGAAAGVWADVSRRFDKKDGLYPENCGIAEVNDS